MIGKFVINFPVVYVTPLSVALKLVQSTSEHNLLKAYAIAPARPVATGENGVDTLLHWECKTYRRPVLTRPD